MTDYSTTLTNQRSRLFEAEALLMFLCDQERLQMVLDADSPEVTLGTMINKAQELLVDATGDCQAMIDLQDEQFVAEHQKNSTAVPSSHNSPDAEEGSKQLNPLGLHAIEQMSILASDNTANLSLLLDLLADMEIDHQANGDCPDYITESRLGAARYAAKVLANKCCESTDMLSNVVYEVKQVEARQAEPQKA